MSWMGSWLGGDVPTGGGGAGVPVAPVPAPPVEASPPVEGAIDHVKLALQRLCFQFRSGDEDTL